MKILVTGVSGFIGSHLGERLLEEGFDVIGVDSFLNYYPKKIKEHNLIKLIKNPKFHFIEGSIRKLNLGNILSGVEAVFHQAAVPGVRASWGKDFNLYVENNVLCTQFLLEACKGRNIKKFIYASSSSVYGEVNSLPIKETSPTTPISPYGVTKLAGENLTTLYYKAYDVPTVSLRYFTVYGPRQRPDMGFHRFISKILMGKEIEVYGAGDQTRDFTFVGDVVEASIKAMFQGRYGEVYNVGGGNRIGLKQAINYIEEISGNNAKLKYADSQKGDAMHTYADITKAKRDLGYSPTIDIYEGLKRQYDWLKDNLDLYK